MKGLIAFFLCVFATLCVVAVDCLQISGSFDTSITIWQSRWKSYNGSNISISSNQVTAVYGYYVASGKRNGFTYYTQAGGGNAIWFGDRRNPYNSFDVWYIGDPNCVAVPARTLSIPRIPTFLPNMIELGARNFDLCSRPSTPGYPTIERITFTDSEYANLVKSFPIYGLDNPTLWIDRIYFVADNVMIEWKSCFTNSTYTVMKSTNLVDWTVAVSNENSSTAINCYHEPFLNKAEVIFFRVIETKK